jgi:hypothetical protein
VASTKPVFITGPYGSPSAALQAAQGLQGIEDATGTGVYMVSAALTAHMTSDIRAVAACLQGTANHGTQTF